MDLHWTLTVSVQFEIDLCTRLDVKVCADSRGSTQVCVVDYNIIEILKIFLCIHKIKKTSKRSSKQDLNVKTCANILLVVLRL